MKDWNDKAVIHHIDCVRKELAGVELFLDLKGYEDESGSNGLWDYARENTANEVEQEQYYNILQLVIERVGKELAKGKILVCSECGEFTSIEDAHTRKDHKYLCEACFDDNYTYCDDRNCKGTTCEHYKDMIDNAKDCVANSKEYKDFLHLTCPVDEVWEENELEWRDNLMQAYSIYCHHEDLLPILEADLEHNLDSYTIALNINGVLLLSEWKTREGF